MTRIELCRDVVANGYRKITVTMAGKQRKVALDHLTAAALICVYDALREDLKPKFETIPWPRLVEFAWKHVRAV